MTRRQSRVFLGGTRATNSIPFLISTSQAEYPVVLAEYWCLSWNHVIMDKFVQRLGPVKAPSDSLLPAQARDRSRHESPAKRVKREIPDSDEEDVSASSSQSRTRNQKDGSAFIRGEKTTAYDEARSVLEPQAGRPPTIESSCPEIKSDEEAVEEYETFRASQGDPPEDTASRFIWREWVKGKSSLYVDAFNLALGTVLDDESHLFDSKERALFDTWAGLSYDAQYL
jgi:fanconi-associated nuclease 1